jgi:hypothetical protein
MRNGCLHVPCIVRLSSQTQASDGGAFIDVTDDSREKMDQAFAQVATMISADVTLEDM